jgi:hypothetical protein
LNAKPTDGSADATVAAIAPLAPANSTAKAMPTPAVTDLPTVALTMQATVQRTNDA